MNRRQPMRPLWPVLGASLWMATLSNAALWAQLSERQVLQGAAGWGLAFALSLMIAASLTALVSLLAWDTAEHGLAISDTTQFVGVLACADTVTYTRPAIAAHGEYQGVGCGRAFNPADRPGR